MHEIQVFRGYVAGLGTVAVKTLKHGSKASSREFKKEVAILRDCVHPNVVRALGACCHPVGPCSMPARPAMQQSLSVVVPDDAAEVEPMACFTCGVPATVAVLTFAVSSAF